MFRVVRPSIATVVGLAPTACPSTSSLSVILDASALDLLRGETAALTVTVTGAGTDPVTLSVSGAPADVTASFEPTTLVGGATSSELTIDVARGAAEGSSLLTLTAVPYDLVAFRSGPDAFGHVFVGLTTAAPSLMPYGALIGGAPPPAAIVDGDLPAVPADHVVRICAEGIDVALLGCATVPQAATSYLLDVTWASGTTAPVRIHFLLTQIEPDGAPVDNVGYHALESSVTDGDIA